MSVTKLSTFSNSQIPDQIDLFWSLGTSLGHFSPLVAYQIDRTDSRKTIQMTLIVGFISGKLSKFLVFLVRFSYLELTARLTDLQFVGFSLLLMFNEI